MLNITGAPEWWKRGSSNKHTSLKIKSDWVSYPEEFPDKKGVVSNLDHEISL